MNLKLSVFLLSLALLLTSCGGKKTGNNMNISENAGDASSSDSRVMIIAKLSVKPEKAVDFIEAAREIIEKSNLESGCIYYQLYQDPYDNSKFVFVEEYKNQAAVDAHFAADYFKSFGDGIADLLLGPSEIKIVTVANEVIK
jgi:quinol monooxygenase YgiN